MALGDLIGWRRSMAVLAVVFASFATRCPGIGRGGTFTKRRCLPLAGARGFFHLADQFRDQRFEFRYTLGKCPTSGTFEFVHALSIADSRSLSCASSARTLNKYEFFNLAKRLFTNEKCPAGYRSLVSRAYYGALHNTVSVLVEKLGIKLPRDYDVHAHTPALLQNANDSDLELAGRSLDTLRIHRNAADYKLNYTDVEKEDFADLRVKEAADIIAIVSGLAHAPQDRRDKAIAAIKSYIKGRFS